MTEYLKQVTIGDAVATAAALVVALGVIRKLWGPVRAVGAFLADWNGKEERTDRAGNVIEEAKPGIPALLETVRSQVQNSHRTNFRDDLDRNTAATHKALERIEHVSTKLDRHIVIAKEADAIADATKQKVEQLAEQLH
ncbi:hypothetical protein [Arthrobacter rhombi]|uniref:hypothetical protein n=1 Tax=Arthrobacter rhombi TaxID=71253 RepID=UPI003FD4821C